MTAQEKKREKKKREKKTLYREPAARLTPHFQRRVNNAPEETLGLRLSLHLRSERGRQTTAGYGLLLVLPRRRTLRPASECAVFTSRDAEGTLKMHWQRAALAGPLGSKSTDVRSIEFHTRG